MGIMRLNCVQYLSIMTLNFVVQYLGRKIHEILPLLHTNLIKQHNFTENRNIHTTNVYLITLVFTKDTIRLSDSIKDSWIVFLYYTYNVKYSSVQIKFFQIHCIVILNFICDYVFTNGQLFSVAILSMDTFVFPSHSLPTMDRYVLSATKRVNYVKICK